MKRFGPVEALVVAMSAAAWGQTGTFQIINGPGAGRQVVANGGVVTASIPPGATTGNLAPPHVGALGPHWHYHGTLLGAADPNPVTFGWGSINFTGAVAGLAPTTASGTIALTQGTPIGIDQLLQNSILDAPQLTKRPADSFAVLFADRRSSGADRDEAMLRNLEDFVRAYDAVNAASHTPQTSASLQAAARWQSIQLTGEKSKP